MNPIIKKLGKNITGEVKIPGDKSISIRASIISSLFFGDFNFKNFNFCGDTKTAISCMDKLAAFSKSKAKKLTLDCDNSATTMRLLAGFICGAFAGEDKTIRLIGDKSLSKRPMNRIITPLKKMGAAIESKKGTAPLTIYLSKCKMKDLKYINDISSAQVKSCLELAAYTSGNKLIYKEPCKSRDHTEIMLNYMHELMHHHGHFDHHDCHCNDYFIPSDTSIASTFITNAIIHNNSKFYMKHVLINPTRTGFLDTLSGLGINIAYKNKHTMQDEKVADIYVDTTKIKAIKAINVKAFTIPKMIDEIMLLALILAKADGVSKIKCLSELKTKESDRLKAIDEMLDILKVKHKIVDDNLTIYGDKALDYHIDIKSLDKNQLKALQNLKNSKDHRILLILKILNIKNIKYEKYLNISL